MANSELYDKIYKIPENIINSIQKAIIAHPSGEGIKRAKFIVKNGQMTYQALKRLKNFFDYYTLDTVNSQQYELAGGDLMKGYVDSILGSDRAAVERSKEIKRDMTANPNSELHAYQPVRNLAESKGKINKNSVAVIVNKDNKILLLKRGEKAPWAPGKWSLVGGGIEDKETPLQGCRREVEEETGIKIKKPVKSFTIQRNPNNIEHIFAVRFDGDPVDIILDEENSNYGWYDIEEMKFLDTVPNLNEYIKLVFTEY